MMEGKSRVGMNPAKIAKDKVFSAEQKRVLISRGYAEHLAAKIVIGVGSGRKVSLSQKSEGKQGAGGGRQGEKVGRAKGHPGWFNSCAVDKIGRDWLRRRSYLNLFAFTIVM